MAFPSFNLQDFYDDTPIKETPTGWMRDQITLRARKQLYDGASYGFINNELNKWNMGMSRKSGQINDLVNFSPEDTQSINADIKAFSDGTESIANGDYPGASEWQRSQEDIKSFAKQGGENSVDFFKNAAYFLNRNMSPDAINARDVPIDIAGQNARAAKNREFIGATAAKASELIGGALAAAGTRIATPLPITQSRREALEKRYPGFNDNSARENYDLSVATGTHKPNAANFDFLPTTKTQVNSDGSFSQVADPFAAKGANVQHSPTDSLTFPSTAQAGSVQPPTGKEKSGAGADAGEIINEVAPTVGKGIKVASTARDVLDAVGKKIKKDGGATGSFFDLPADLNNVGEDAYAGALDFGNVPQGVDLKLADERTRGTGEGFNSVTTAPVTLGNIGTEVGATAIANQYGQNANGRLGFGGIGGSATDFGISPENALFAQDFQTYADANPLKGPPGGIGKWFGETFNKESMFGPNGWVSPLATAGLGAFNVWQGMQSHDLAQDQFDFQKSYANRNIANQAKLLNAGLEGQQRALLGSLGGATNHNYRSVADKMSKYGVDGSAIG